MDIESRRLFTSELQVVNSALIVLASTITVAPVGFEFAAKVKTIARG